MSENKKTQSKGLVTGMMLGAAVGAGLTFLFGTKKGKDLQKGLRNKYPDLFSKIDDVVVDVKENVSEGYDSVSKQVTKKTAGVRKLVSDKIGDLGKVVGINQNKKPVAKKKK